LENRKDKRGQSQQLFYSGEITGRKDITSKIIVPLLFFTDILPGIKVAKIVGKFSDAVSVAEVL
jgi:hypothetical protein